MAQSLGAEALRQAHVALIERWGDLHQLPDAADRPYAWRWIGYHLEQAGRKKELDGLLQDLPWLARKLEEIGIAALEGDFDYASDQPPLERLRRLLRNASHVLAAHPDQLPVQLLARWPESTKPPPGEERLRQQAITQIQKAGGWRPSSASLLASEALLRTLIGHTDRICALAVLPDGRLASGSGDHTIRLWNLATGACAATLEGHTGVVWALAVLPDGRLASGSGDATIKLWDPASGDPGSGELIFVADAAISALAAIPGALPLGASLLVAGDASGRLHWLKLV